MGVLYGEELENRLQGDNPLVSPLKPEQIQPNGVELTLASVSRIEGAGRLAFDNSERRLPDYKEMAFDDEGWIFLSPGIYLATYNEVVNIHKDLFAFARPRSSLLRMGATLYTALWDTGYIGRSQTPINVINPDGLYLQKGARLLQLVFVTLGDELTAVYNGVYHGENI